MPNTHWTPEDERALNNELPPKPHLIPVRYSIEWVSAEVDMEEARILFGSVEDWVERGGGFVQGGLVQRMEDVDVIPDSPLARALNG